MNLDNSTNLFNINISIIKSFNNNNKSRVENLNLNEEENMDSKEEFFEGEKINNIK